MGTTAKHFVDPFILESYPPDRDAIEATSGQDHIRPVRAHDSIVPGIADDRGALSEASLGRESLRGCSQQSHNRRRTDKLAQRSGSCHGPSLSSTRIQAKRTPHHVAVEVTSTLISDRARLLTG
jgi:hypothetical protein